MTELDDHELLAEFARSESEEAFAALVTRHVNLVYSAALRFSGNPHHAQEITQAVFIILARKAGSLRRCKLLSGWLYQTARLTAASFVRGEIRRQHREQEAHMQSILNESEAAPWEQIAPLLDEAMGRLGETDRNALVLRFFENKTAREVGAALKLTEAAAHKRVNRALEKLRKFFTKRGVTLSATVIAGAVAANSVQAAPVGLAVTVTAAAAKGAGISAAITTLVKGTLKVLACEKFKFGAGISMGILLAVGVVAYSSFPRKVAPRTVAVTFHAVGEAQLKALVGRSYTETDEFEVFVRDTNWLIRIHQKSFPSAYTNVLFLDYSSYHVGDTIFTIASARGKENILSKLLADPKTPTDIHAIRAYHIDAIPTVYVIGRQGRIVAVNPRDLSQVVNHELEEERAVDAK